MTRHGIVATISCFLGASFVQAGKPGVIPDLQPRMATFPAGESTLKQALDLLEKQTGNVVADRRTNPTNPKFLLPKGAGFWPALDAIGKQTGIGFSAYQPDGGVALVDSSYRELRTSYDGLFRFAIKRIAVSRDDETQTHHCDVKVDIAWEPRFQPLYVGLNQATANFARRQENLERQTPRSVAGISATEMELRIAKAPPRNVQFIDSLAGSINVIGAPKMLDFAFKLQEVKAKKDKALTQTQEGVKVSLTQVQVAPAKTRWTVELLLEYPKDAIVPLESYQASSWMENNRIWLQWTDPQTKRSHKLEPLESSQEEEPRGARMQFYFTPRENTPLPPNLNAATLHYLTPNRVIAFTVPFRFQNLPLP